jgi:hypothetical protein
LTTSHWYVELWKIRLPAWNWNSVVPSGTVAPFLYLDTKPKLALPVELSLDEAVAYVLGVPAVA